MIENLKEKERVMGRVYASPFFVGWARGQFGGRSSDGAKVWLQAFDDRVIRDDLTEEDDRLIEMCEASIQIASDLNLPSSNLSDQQQARVMQKLIERYPLPPDEEDDDADS